MYSHERKKEWVERYKKVFAEFRNEERRLIQTLAEDFHINKIFLSYNSEVENEKKSLEDSRLGVKFYLDEAYSYFNGAQKGKNFDIKQRLVKLKETLLKNRIENKNRFENLLQEEDVLQKEIEQFENEYDFSKNQEDEEMDRNHNSNENKEEFSTPINNRIISEFEEYIEYVMNSANIIFEKYTEDEVFKIINKLNDLNYIKEKTNLLDNLIEKLGGQNLTWQGNYHQDFLRIKAIYNGKINTYEFLTALENTLPFFPRSELKNHIKLYNKYQQLVEAKKLLISKYKSIKSEKDDSEKKQVLEKIITPVHNVTNFNPVDKNKLDEWKQKKQQEQMMKENIKKQIDKEKKDQERQKYLEKCNKIKPLIDEYKKKKEIEKEKQFESTNTKTEINEIDIQRIKEKNEKLLENKMLVKKAKPYERIRSAKSYTNYKLKKLEKFENMEPKINEFTEGYIHKQRDKHNPIKDKPKHVETMGGNVLYRTNRAVPEWRKSLY